jgi:hypothetical protein
MLILVRNIVRLCQEERTAVAKTLLGIAYTRSLMIIAENLFKQKTLLLLTGKYSRKRLGKYPAKDY